MSSENRIQIAGINYRYIEDICGVAFTPGHLIQTYDVAGVKKLKKHATEGGYAEKLFAVESPLQGATATSVESRTIDTAYAAGERASYHAVMPGDVVNVWLKAGESVVHGDHLISGGDGTLIKNGSEASGTTVRQIVATAEEVKDNSASGAVAVRILARIL